jgi:hypothetical protein
MPNSTARFDVYTFETHSISAKVYFIFSAGIAWRVRNGEMGAVRTSEKWCSVRGQLFPILWQSQSEWTRLIATFSSTMLKSEFWAFPRATTRDRAEIVGDVTQDPAIVLRIEAMCRETAKQGGTAYFERWGRGCDVVNLPASIARRVCALLVELTAGWE